MGQREVALELLASKESSGPGFFDVAARALTIGLDCRWAGFGRLLEDFNTVEVMAFCDATGPSETFRYSIEDSPCGQVYSASPDQPYRFYPNGVTSEFSGPPILAQIGAVAYRGEAIFDSSGIQAAHAFAISELPFNEDPQDEAFFRLVGQRAGAEYNRQRAEQAMIKSKEEADAANKVKSEFLANISHELRTPLNAIIGFSDLMESETFGPLGDARYKEYINGINSSGHHLLDIIMNILDISKVESGHISLHEAEFQLLELINLSVSTVNEEARKKRITIQKEFDIAVSHMYADSVKIKQIVLNLLSNAVKFTPQNGRVTVSVQSDDNRGIVIEVSDTGIGIESENLLNVLEPFRQVDASTRNQPEGTGLGLPLAKMLTNLHGGEFDLRSEPSQGTTVTLRFPPARNLSQPD